MAEVIKAKVGVGWLGPGQTAWWKWYITDADAWYFWASNAGGVGPGETPEDVEVLRMVCRQEYYPGDIHKEAALIQLYNRGSTNSSYVLRVVRVI